LRLDLGVGRGHHDKVKTGGVQSKFGWRWTNLTSSSASPRPQRASSVWAHALGLRISGYFRIGAMSTIQLASIGERHSVACACSTSAAAGVPARSDEPLLDLAALNLALAEIKIRIRNSNSGPKPGRYLVADAGVLLARVTQLKRKGEVRYVGIDAGMNSLIRPRCTRVS